MENNNDIVHKVKEVILDCLNLEDLTVEDIEYSSPLFGDGLGLDSIDALELGLGIKEKFKVHLDVDSNIKEHFYSVETLTKFIMKHAPKRGELEE